MTHNFEAPSINHYFNPPLRHLLFCLKFIAIFLQLIFSTAIFSTTFSCNLGVPYFFSLTVKLNSRSRQVIEGNIIVIGSKLQNGLKSKACCKLVMVKLELEPVILCVALFYLSRSMNKAFIILQSSSVSQPVGFGVL